MAVSTLVGRVITMATAADTYAGKGVIDFIRWVGPTTNAHTLALQNTATEVLYADKCAAAEVNGTKTSPKFEKGLPFNGLLLATMGSGTLYVHLR